jgi:hypothetical protein
LFFAGLEACSRSLWQKKLNIHLKKWHDFFSEGKFMPRTFFHTSITLSSVGRCLNSYENCTNTWTPNTPDSVVKLHYCSLPVAKPIELLAEPHSNGSRARNHYLL